MFNAQQANQFKPGSVESNLIKCLAYLYTGRIWKDYDSCVQALTNGLFAKYIERAGGKFKEVGVFTALSVFGSLLEFGSSSPNGNPRSLIRRAFEESKRQRLSQQGESAAAGFPYPFPPLEELTSHEIDMSEGNIAVACRLAFGLFAVALQYPQNKSVQPMIHCYLAFLKNLVGNASAMKLIEREIPWSLLVSYLNHHASPTSITSQVTREDFPKPPGDVIGRPLPEDFLMRGQIFVEDYYPATWFSDADIDEEERVLELPSMSAPRLERILHNGYSIAKRQRWITFNSRENKFEETQFAKELPSPETVADPSISSTEDTLILEPLEDEKMLDDSEPVESTESISPKRSQGQPRSDESSRNVFGSKTPTILKKENMGDVKMTGTSRESSAHTSRSKKSPVPFPNVKNVDPVKGTTGYVTIYDDSTEPTDS